MRFAIGEEHQHAIGRVGGGPEELGTLGKNRREVGSPFTGEIGVQGIEVHPYGAAIHGEVHYHGRDLYGANAR